MKTSDVTKSPFRIMIGCVAQGVLESEYDEYAARAWVEQEIEFWKRLNLPNVEITIGQTRSSVRSPSAAYLSFWRETLNQDRWSTFAARLTSALEAAERLRFILSEGLIADRLEKMASPHMRSAVPGEPEFEAPESVAHPQALVLGASAYSMMLAPELAIDPGTLALLQAMNGVAAMAPSATANAAFQELQSVLDESRAQMRESIEYQRETERELGPRLEAIERLEQTYSEKLKLEGPAQYWAGVHESAEARSFAWLAVFGAALLVPAVTLADGWDSWVSPVLTSLADAPLGGIALISIVALAYGWGHKHISRLFVQNSQIAADARQREIMVMTYLGLAKDAHTEITDQERALTLNALFRPAPPSQADDGPPAGLLELIKSK